MKFEEVDFYDYKIRMCLDNGIPMYLVSDLLRQCNEKHGTNKQFTDFLQNKKFQEMIKDLAKREGGNQKDKLDICNVIQYISFSDLDSTNTGYIICEELLHMILMWLDPIFAWNVFHFLSSSKGK